MANNHATEELMQPIPESLMVFEQAREQITQLVDKCIDFVISSDESLESAKQLAKDAKSVEKMIEDRRKEITKPILDEKKRIDDFAKSLTDDLNNGIKSLRVQILNFEQEKDRIRKEELRKIEEERRIQEEELRKQMAEKEEINQEDLDKLQTIRRQQADLAQVPVQNSIRKTWTFDVLDLMAVPISYLMVDEQKVKQAISAGVRDIPGMKIYQKESLALR